MITIAWDVDDVLNNLMGEWLKAWRSKHKTCRVNFSQIEENPPHRLLAATRSEYEASLDSFRLSGVYLDLKPNHEVLNWFKQYGGRARHVAITAVPLKAAHISAFWVMRNFGLWIRSFNFVPSARQGEKIIAYDAGKADYLKWLAKVDILVEDSTDNIEKAQAAGVVGVLIKKPWNKNGFSVKDALAKINKLIK